MYSYGSGCSKRQRQYRPLSESFVIVDLPQKNMDEFLHKVIVIGKERVGKSCLINRYVNNTFDNNYKQTTGVDYLLKVIRLSSKTLRISFWDIAGQENTKILTRSYFSGASACIIVYDITNKASFDEVREWKKEIDTKLGSIPTILLGNKFDLIDDGTHSQCVDDLDIEEMADSLNIRREFHVSAKTGYQVKQSMKFLSELLLNENQTTSTSYKRNISISKESVPLMKTEPQDISNTSLCSSC